MLLLVDLAQALGGVLRGASGREVVQGVAYDSRAVRRGDAFVAIPGFKTDGARFVSMAIARGAGCVICEATAFSENFGPTIVVPSARAALAKIAWLLAGHAHRKLRLIGVTGTNGKTTVTAALGQLLTLCGHPTGVCGTLGMYFGDTRFDSDRTTAEAPELAAAFGQMIRDGCTHAALEATSIGLELHRLDELVFDVAVFTNLTRDHLDFHGSWEAYRSAKLSLFAPHRLRGAAVINADDPEHGHFLRACSSRVLTYGIDSPADFRASAIEYAPSGTAFTLDHPSGTARIRTAMIGRFNVHNILAVIASAYALGEAVDTTKNLIPGVKPVRGRSEVVDSTAPFSVIVDYAHTPDALEKILTTVRGVTSGRVMCLIGAGGDRDKGKRPLMAQAATKLSDVTYLTSDNPRTEDPEQIVADMQAGVVERDNVRVLVDRREAIFDALSHASSNDAIVIAGKGHETYQEIHGVKHPFDDAAIASQWLRAHGY